MYVNHFDMNMTPIPRKAFTLYSFACKASATEWCRWAKAGPCCVMVDGVACMYPGGELGFVTSIMF